jgi:hypothetical protein
MEQNVDPRGTDDPPGSRLRAILRVGSRRTESWKAADWPALQAARN